MVVTKVRRVLAMFLLAALFLSVSNSAVMAVGADANFQINGELLTQLTLTKVTDLKFGKFSKTGAGTVVIAAADGARSQTLLVSLQGGETSRATFTVTGTANYNYSITMTDGLAAASVVTAEPGVNIDMDVDLVINGVKANRTIDGTGNHTIEIGGTLHVDADQVGGVYALALPHAINITYD